jgi:acyl-CoA thioester hydrolase
VNKKTYTKPIDVRVSDIARGNHVNNAVFYTYFEEGLKHFLNDLIPERTWSYLLAHSECDYKRPILYKDKPQLTITIANIGNTSITVNYLITDCTNSEQIYAEGKTVLVSYDYEANKPVPLKDEMKALLEGYR